MKIIRQALHLLDLVLMDMEGGLGLPSEHRQHILSAVDGLVVDHGEEVLFRDLPAIGKLLDLSLSNNQGFIDLNKLPLPLYEDGEGLERHPLWLILSTVYDSNGFLKPDHTEEQIFALRQFFYCFKSYDSPCPKDLTVEAVREFYGIEREMRAYDESWGYPWLHSGVARSFLDCVQDERQTDLFDLPRFSTRDTRDLLRNLEKVCDRVFQFGNISPESLIPKHGPGAVSDMKRGMDKYQFPSWSEKLDLHFPKTLFAFSREDGILDFEDDRPMSDREFPARLIAVPKTPVKPRLIASEPTSNQYCQQAVLRWIREKLPRVCRRSIDFLSQEPSRQFAVKASVMGTYSTIDLSSASDRLSCWVVERAFRKSPDFLSYLNACRTHITEIPESIRPPGFSAYIFNKKYANQGNATTFPVQTIIYWACAVATQLTTGRLEPSLKNIGKVSECIRIFGDDIIMPSYSVPYLCHLLSYLGLKVNMGKTHMRGSFRESCGMDAYRGRDVTPIAIHSLAKGTQPNAVLALIDTSNNLHKAGLWKAAEYMLTLLPREVRRYLWASNQPQGCLSLFSFQSGVSTPQRGKWCKSLHLYKAPGIQVSVQKVRGKRSSHINLLQYFVERPAPDSKWESGYFVRDRSKLKLRWVHHD